MNLRPGHLDDAIAIGELWFDSWMSTKPVSPNVTKADLVKRASAEIADRWEVTIAEIDYKLVGFLAVAPSEQRLDQLYVAPSAQGHGVGKQLLCIAKERFLGGFWLKVDARNNRARKFYEREGLSLTIKEIEDGRPRLQYVFKKI